MSANARVLGRGIAALVRTDSTPTPDTLPTDRQRLRSVIESQQRPSPGTSELLSRPLAQEVTGFAGKDVITYDLLGLAPVHLLGGSVDKAARKKLG